MVINIAIVFFLALFNKLSELELMIRISRTNDLKELNNLFNSLYDMIFPSLWRKLSHTFKSTIGEEALKDAFQDGWKKVLLNRKNFSVDYKQFNWIYTIIRNTILDLNKKNITESKIFIEKNLLSIVEDNEEVNYIENIKIDSIPIDEQLHLKNVYDTIVGLINSIEIEKDREILKLRLIDDKRLDEISKEVNLPLSTVNYRINKMLVLLRPKLKLLLEL